jgi:hypothetical protein
MQFTWLVSGEQGREAALRGFHADRQGGLLNTRIDTAVLAHRAPRTDDDAPGWFRRAIHPFVPAGFQDPVGLARRLLRSKDPAAMFAMRAAAIAPLYMPLDLLLRPFEQRRYRRAAPPERPIILVCGPARSGTTLAAQLLIRNLPVAYLDNLVSIFPRAPLTAMCQVGKHVPHTKVIYRSYYGRTDGWSAPNDALNLWDRWLGGDRSHAPDRIPPKERSEMIAFFGALERQTGKPVVAKNNALNACAHLVAEALPTARFVCLQRSRTSLALSLYKARLDIHGRPTVPYGLTSNDERCFEDAIEDVCRQVLYHEALAREQQARLGAERFMLVQYEDVCREPRVFIENVGRVFLGAEPDFSTTDPELRAFNYGHRVGDGELLSRLRETFIRLGAECEFPSPGNSQPAAAARA